MADLINLDHLHVNRVQAVTVQRLRGVSGSGHVVLHESRGFKELLDAHASALLTSRSLRVTVDAPVKESVSLSVVVAVIPGHITDNPTTRAHVLSIPGSVTLQRSVFLSSAETPVSFGAETSERLKPEPLIGSLPKVVFHWHLLGGEQDSESLLKIQAEVELSGIGFIKTW